MPFITGTSTSTSTASDSTTKGCIKAERDALLAFKAQIIHHKAHPISSWGDQNDDDCCHWAGVRCDNISGHILRLNLQRKQPRHYHDYDYDLHNGWCDDQLSLSGNISESLIGHQHLKYLDLSNNCFFNISIPKFLGSLEHLVHLDLSYSSFTGIIPHELGNLTRLRYLNLANYYNKVDDAEWLSGLSSIRYFFMDHVNFSGVENIMQSLNKLRHLKNVSLFACRMNSIPESLPHLNFTSLTFMDIGLNMFDNTSIPEWLFRIPNLRELYMYYTGFTGAIPSSVGNATSLQFLSLAGNGGISGDMPSGFGDLCNLQRLLLGGTFVGKSLEEDFRDAFSGCISCVPSSIGNAASLQFLFLSGNRGISGDMPREFGDLCNLQLLQLDGTFVGKSLEEDFRDTFSRCIRQNLTGLSFQDSSLQGPLPDWLGEFTNLNYLDLSSNSFNSSIPASIGRLSKLQELHLYDNALNGSIPASIGSLSKLQELHLYDNALNGSIPESFGRLSGLEYLDLSGNDLNGPIPESLPQLSNLLRLDLGYNFNYYNSVITEAHLANLTSLKNLTLDHTNLVLNISTDRIPGFQPNGLFLSYCNIGPKFPVWLANQVNLDVVDISNAGIKDSIPDWFWNITYSILYLDLSNNEINGRLPHSFKFQAKLDGVSIFLGSNRFEGSVPYFPPNLDALNLSSNLLSGNIPSDLGNFGGISPQLTSLSLSSNNLIGSIPNSLCNFKYLVLLELSNNHFEGAIPNCWNNLTSLQYLNLANNSLASEVPNSLINSSLSLQVLHLSNNQLHGEFPSFLKKCTSMTTLIFDNNNFSGEIPNWVGETMTSLMILTLKENNFSGNLPLLSNLTSLHFLDLSHNSFVGSIPQSYGNLTGMINTSMNGGAGFSSNISEVLVITMTVSTKGLDLQYGVILSSFKFIDLSANKLSGQIPKEIVNLVALQNLDLSCNKLSGEIPSNIGLMQSLESLNLSRNVLIGSIPPSLSTIDFLGSLNLSHNNLSGKIPYTRHLTTFNDPSMYAGNLNLCGAPLDKNCTNDEPTSNSQANGQEDDNNDSPPIWFYLGLMPGFVVGFWIVWGILLFKKEWRYLYFKYLDHMYDMMYVKIMITVPKIKRLFFVMRSM
ncbi:receptor-like protein EIX2 [Dioscorea cayenensis subsp. rotundata]|uniref:Receptor-like protein EIX2 n=1 Tax=Dioscorea cayennensis subsp. rotundata TaxID=55577 RepID=A0AB40C7N9_DIOCR|nr:receptor-like protein EIX2 [Dioscorea cayenensis subsp. rotundata]